MPLFRSSNADIYYEIHGTGPVVMMVAGMASDSKSWQYVIGRLSEHHRVVIFDNRGCGRTKSHTPSFSLDDMVRDALGLIDHLDYEKVHLVGHSMGGMVAQEMALSRPGRIGRLVLASTGPSMSDRGRKILEDLYSKWENGYDREDWYRMLFRFLFTQKTLENEKFMDAAVFFALAYPYQQSLEGFKGQVDAISTFNATGRIRHIKHNTLILSGAEDTLIPPEESRALMDIGGPATFKIIGQAAHSIHAELPGAFCDAVLEFLGGRR